MRRKLLAALFLLLLVLASVAGAEGRVVFLDGDVRIVRDGASSAAEIGSPLATEDVLETGPAATAIVDLGNGVELKLRENTRTRIASLEERSRVDLERGGLFALVRRVFRGSFSVNTRTVVAGVRGTQFFMAYGRSIEERPDVWLCVNEGTVNVAASPVDGGAGGERLVRAGEGINILAGTELTEPQFYDWTRDLNWNMDPEEGEVFDDTDLDQAYSDLLDQDYD